MYRSHIVDTLANELAQQQQLGMAEMINEHWNLKPQMIQDNQSGESSETES